MPDPTYRLQFRGGRHLENLLDEEYVTGATTATDDSALWTAIPGQPQTFGLILEANF
ncbi:MAG: hypothetical protein AAGI24_15110 [Pseudomonadota bacterium]